MRHILFLTAGLAFLWLANSGHYSGLILSLGALSIAFVVFVTIKMKVVDAESQPVRISYRIPLYWLWLSKQIILSNISVVKKIWFSPSSIDPAVARIKTSQTSDLGRVIYANSITLTPGTVTLDVTEDEVEVHVLCRESLSLLQNGVMDQQVKRLES
ncbi:hypothetical protein TDB9533_03061 [Thalassocella blandensis]|nr:hypothetical protein TDB9533_03061 [Thalassocella blandensis]